MAAAASDPGSCEFVGICFRVSGWAVGGVAGRYDRSMTDPATTPIEFRLDLTDDELAELERALLKARATELGEVRRRQIRLSAGYGDSTTRETMDSEADRAQLRYDALTKLIEAMRLPTS
jgi:hypothetical protein